MNSEELERSLRSEFENYMKGVAAELKQETSEFQQRISAELDKQRQSIDEAFAAFTARFDSETEFDEAFSASVSEHLRLARDEGAKITATAFAEAEKLEEQSAQKPASYDAIRDAVDDISSKDSQSAILKALVTRASEFAPRGAFFVIKNEHLAGWKVFGESEAHAAEAVREIHFPVEADSILGEAVRTVRTAESTGGGHAADSMFLEPLGFGHPDRMYAVPLIARGRAVAVLYADYGHDGTNLSREALETLVRVAGLTVELLAAMGSQSAPAAHEEPQRDLRSTGEYAAPSYQQPEEAAQPAEQEAQSEQPAATDFSFSESVSYEGGFPGTEPQTGSAPTFEHSFEQPASGYQEPAPEWQPHDEPSFEQSNGAATGDLGYGEASIQDAGYSGSPFQQEVEEPQFGVVEPDAVGEPAAELVSEEVEAPDLATTQAFEPAEFDTAPSFESAPSFEPTPSFEPEPSFEPPPATPFRSFEPASQPVAAHPAVEKSVVPVAGSRLSDRPVDLPIEVPEEERRSHNDARRFARLLVSEIKLYNEKKVLEGRQSRDLYQRLQEAIDRSREMYDKRVQPPVAAKFDYFHYELVNSLAEGEPGRLGSNYPGPTV